MQKKTFLKEDEKELWDALKRGNRDAFLVVYESSYQALYVHGLASSSSVELTKDAIHEMFLEIWENRQKLNSVSKITPYLKVYLRRKLLKAKVRLGKEDGQVVDLQTEPSYEDLVVLHQARQEKKELVVKALEKLTDAQKEVLRLRFYEGMSYEEIAELKSTQTRTVYNLVHQAVKKMKTFLSNVPSVVFLLGALFF
ncbi:sigma-70 family RNA polymerase sigma factor [Flammeovirgaceae bacterium SG7u.111]|nr:sigma-70 family RNA polymerase sigma factor [Flammeovirgaceae bacterium SG7u.132]WPO33926.1 sigma-70 family RNA polymerase sigma factor [Flammeovirgaceae bacterium SG7u.111]